MLNSLILFSFVPLFAHSAFVIQLNLLNFFKYYFNSICMNIYYSVYTFK